MLSITRELEFGNLKIIVRELTVAEVRKWLSDPSTLEQSDSEFDVLTGLMSFDEINVNDIYRFTDLKKEDVEGLEDLIQAAHEDAANQLQKETSQNMEGIPGMPNIPGLM